MILTTNFKLEKPGLDDLYDIVQFNRNMDSLDETLGQLAEGAVQVLNLPALLPASGWSVGPPYTQTLHLDGITAGGYPLIIPDYSTVQSVAVAQRDALACICEVETREDEVRFSCFESKPDRDLPILIRLADSMFGQDAPPDAGKSAYEIAVEHGFAGTEAEWLASLKGEKGDPGATGAVGPQGPAGRDGVDGTSFTIRGRYDTLAALTAAHPTGAAGDAYAVGSEASNVIYVWAEGGAWESIGPMQGPKGEKGDTGATGPQGPPGVSAQDFTATITTTWTGSAAPYTQNVAISGITAAMQPMISPVYDAALATALAQKEAWACVSKAVSYAGGVTFTCFEDKPAVAIPIQIKVVG